MDITTILLGVLILISLVIVGLLVARKSSGATDPGGVVAFMNDFRREMMQATNRDRSETQERIDNLNNQLMRSMTESSKAMQKQHEHTSTIVKDVTERLTKLDETNKQVLGFSEQLQSLENILKNPKQRGILGEFWLETLLGQVLQPTQYEMQYDLGNDEDSGQKLIPDAVIFVKEMLIPIDAKFSLENYNRISMEKDENRRVELEKIFKNDVKKRIDETSKYIRPEMKTSDFAFMFVPADGIYNNLITSTVGAVQINSKNLIEYAFDKRVLIVSPTSFYAYLQTVLHGLRALKIEESVREFQKAAQQWTRHMNAYLDYHTRLGKQLETTYKTYSASSNELRKIDKDIFKITEGGAGKEMEVLEIEAPVQE